MADVNEELTAAEEKRLMDAWLATVSYTPEVHGDPAPDESDEDSE
jgi:hypothetical protein